MAKSYFTIHGNDISATVAEHVRQPIAEAEVTFRAEQHNASHARRSYKDGDSEAGNLHTDIASAMADANRADRRAILAAAAEAIRNGDRVQAALLSAAAVKGKVYKASLR
jgi:hypothetical protein